MKGTDRLALLDGTWLVAWQEWGVTRGWRAGMALAGRGAVEVDGRRQGREQG